MTFFEWIRRCILSDAKRHPVPYACRRELRKLLRRMRRAELSAQKQ